MSGYGDFIIRVYRDGEEIAEAEAAWAWDDDDEDKIRITACIPKPEDF